MRFCTLNSFASGDNLLAMVPIGGGWPMGYMGGMAYWL